MLYQLGLDLGILRRSGKPIGKSKHDLYRCFRAGEYPPPSGDPTPPRADIDMTKQIADAAKPLGIALQDHIIIGREGHASLKGLRLIGAGEVPLGERTGHAPSGHARARCSLIRERPVGHAESRSF